MGGVTPLKRGFAVSGSYAADTTCVGPQRAPLSEPGSPGLLSTEILGGQLGSEEVSEGVLCSVETKRICPRGHSIRVHGGRAFICGSIDWRRPDWTGGTWLGSQGRSCCHVVTCLYCFPSRSPFGSPVKGYMFVGIAGCANSSNWPVLLLQADGKLQGSRGFTDASPSLQAHGEAFFSRSPSVVYYFMFALVI